MEIEDFLAASQVTIGMRASDKRDLLKELARRAAAALALDADPIASALLQREQLGSTGTGGGIAIPHARVAGVGKPFGMLVRLAKPIDFDSIDGKPVDIVFLLLLPAGAQGEQLNALASVARKLRDVEVLRKVRGAREGNALYHALVR